MKTYNALMTQLFANDLDIINFKQLAKTKGKPNTWCFIDWGWASDHGLIPLIEIMSSGGNLNIVITSNNRFTYTSAMSNIDLGAIAMTFSKVYVASIALMANKAQAEKAFLEASKHKGVSIILAHEFIAESAYDTERQEELTQAIVNSGQWLLYRNNPDLRLRNFNSFILDSDPPSISIKAYLQLKDPFVELLGEDFLNYESNIKAQQKRVDQRFDHYLALSAIGYINRSKLLQNARIKNHMIPKT